MFPLKRNLVILCHLAAYGSIMVWLGPAVLGMSALVLLGLLVWISVVDFERYEIPDLASALLVVTGVWQLIARDRMDQVDAMLGAFFWPLAFWIVGAVYLRARNVHGLGFGDVKLMVGIGLWCGFTNSVWVVLGAALSGLAVMSCMVILRKKKPALTQQAIAFGPYLCLSAWYIWLVDKGV